MPYVELYLWMKRFLNHEQIIETFVASYQGYPMSWIGARDLIVVLTSGLVVACIRPTTAAAAGLAVCSLVYLSVMVQWGPLILVACILSILVAASAFRQARSRGSRANLALQGTQASGDAARLRP
jgi:hypothetical protein